MPQRRGRLDEATAIRVGGIPQPPPGWWDASEAATSDRARGRPRRAAMQLLYSTPTPESPLREVAVRGEVVVVLHDHRPGKADQSSLAAGITSRRRTSSGSVLEISGTDATTVSMPIPASHRRPATSSPVFSPRCPTSNLNMLVFSIEP